MIKERAVDSVVNSMFLASVTGLIVNSVQEILMWLLVMFAVVFCDLVAACRRVLLMKEEFRFSRALRNTMAKMVTYFAFVVMMVFIDNASASELKIDKWAILFIIFTEVCSIVSNILKVAGYDFDFGKLITMLLKKLFNIDKEYSEGVIKKTDENKQEGN